MLSVAVGTAIGIRIRSKSAFSGNQKEEQHITTLMCDLILCFTLIMSMFPDPRVIHQI